MARYGKAKKDENSTGGESETISTLKEIPSCNINGKKDKLGLSWGNKDETASLELTN